MSEKNITLISKDYAESIFVTGPKFDSLSTFVSGPDAQVQGKLTASTGINLNDNTISVDTATAVGDSNLPVTASAVNTKLGDYATTTDLNNKFLSGSYQPYGSYGSTEFVVGPKISNFKIGGDYVNASIAPAYFNIHNSDGPVDADFTVTTNVGAFTPSATISIPCDDGSGYTTITSNRGAEVMRFQHDISAGYDVHNTKIYFNAPVYDKDGNEITGGGGGSSFNYISEDDNWPYSLSLGRGPNGTANSIFVCGPLYGEDGTIFVNGPIKFSEAYDKDGREIKGGGGGAGYDYITEDHTDKSLTLQTGDGLYFCVDEHSTFTNGPIALLGGWGPGTIISDATNNDAVGNMGGFVIRHLAGEGQQFKIGVAADMTWTDAVLELESYDSSGNSTGFCQLDGDKLNKLSSLINKADELLALLNN